MRNSIEDRVEKPKMRIILDSGAFSCWTRNTDIDLYKYIKFIQDNKESIWHPVNLDRIPGLMGIRPSATAVAAAAQESWDNSMIMRKEGVEPIPVYHQGESRVWLERMLDAGFKYIGISPSNSCKVPERQRWLDQVFDFLCGGKYPPVMTHAFGLTAVTLMVKYPWLSVDSMRWMVEAGWGHALVPRPAALGSGERYDFAATPYSIRFSRGSLKERRKGHIRNTVNGSLNQATFRHYFELGAQSKAYVDAYIKEFNLDTELLLSDFNERARMNVRFFQQVESRHQITPFGMKKSGLFYHSNARKTVGVDEKPPWKFEVVYTVNGTKQASDMVTNEGCTLTLVSYFNFMGSRLFDLKKYAETGFIEPVSRVSKKKIMRQTLDDFDTADEDEFEETSI